MYLVGWIAKSKRLYFSIVRYAHIQVIIYIAKFGTEQNRTEQNRTEQNRTKQYNIVMVTIMKSKANYLV